MALTVLVGGARSGKSALAVRLAQESGKPVTFVATAEARDEEMAARIARHRAERPPAWRTVEEPTDLERALLVAGDDVVLVDCLTLWTANRAADGAAAVLAAAGAVASRAAQRAAPTLVVTNEVGHGLVPLDEMARAWRDLLGSVNQTFVSAAEQAFLVVAGRALRLDSTAGVSL